MIATVKAVPPAQFEAWLAYQKQQIAQANAAAKVARAKLNAQAGPGRRSKTRNRSEHSRRPPPAMATYAAPVPQVVAHHVEREAHGWTSWITTTDHKRIGIMYMVTTFVFFCLGGVEALMMRLQLGAPNNTLVTPADLQPAVHDARDDDDLPVRRADDGGPGELLPAADDRRARHGLSRA